MSFCNKPCLNDTAILRTAVAGGTLSPIANLFWNARERRLRAGWRVVIFLVIMFVLAAVDGRVRAGLAGRLPDLYEDLVRVVFALLIAAACTWRVAYSIIAG